MDIENKKIKSQKNKKVLIPLLLILAVVVISTSFALWQLTFTQSGTNVITTGCLKLTLKEDTDAINITDATPTSDTDGKALNPFTFTLENVCTTETKYVINLETLSNEGKTLADNYVKANLVSGSNELFLDNLVTKHINEEKVISDATKAYKLHQGKLGNKEKISFSLRLWMDENTPATDAVMDATWQGKVTVTASYIPPVDTKNMMVAMEYSEDYFNSYYNNINLTYTSGYRVNKVVFQDKMNPIEGEELKKDFSDVQDGSVLGYYVKNGGIDVYSNDETYTLYIQANGKIKMNPNASYYFFVQSEGSGSVHAANSNFEGIENLDTSLVIDMSSSFAGINNDSLNLSNFNTSQVNNMSSMFVNFKGNQLDLSSFDTRQVTDMSYMFSSCSNLTRLDLSSFDTSKVTDMSYMFYVCSNLSTTINITNPNVENYEDMFHGAATEEGAQITVNYTEETSDLVDRMIATKSSNSNVVKGVLIQ